MQKFYTSQLYKVNSATIPDKLFLDITVKSATGLGEHFAPTWDMVWGSKKGIITWEEYTKQYYELMRREYKIYQQEFVKLLSMERDVVLCCYCKDTSDTTQHCHRYLAIDILHKIAMAHGIAFCWDGEL